MSARSYIKSLTISGSRMRTDCPTCNGSNCLGIYKRGSDIIWNCFRATCKEKGVIKDTPSMEEISNVVKFPTQETSINTFKLPQRLVHWSANVDCRRYCIENHITNAIQEGRAMVRYDPQLNRAVFVVRDEKGVPVNAIGRLLAKNRVAPKWYKYAPSNEMFMCESKENDPKHLILVEDAASACSASRICSSVAILGTDLKNMYPLSYYDTILVALDPDALNKSLDLTKALSYWYSAKVVVLKDDLKYYNTDELYDQFNKWLKQE